MNREIKNVPINLIWIKFIGVMLFKASLTNIKVIPQKKATRINIRDQKAYCCLVNSPVDCISIRYQSTLVYNGVILGCGSSTLSNSSICF